VTTRKPPPKTQFFLAILNFDLAKSLILASQKKKEKKRLLMALVFMNINLGPNIT
jgi:hypothetical protein